jgi:hypothetical protein
MPMVDTTLFYVTTPVTLSTSGAIFGERKALQRDVVSLESCYGVN